MSSSLSKLVAEDSPTHDPPLRKESTRRIHFRIGAENRKSAPDLSQYEQVSNDDSDMSASEKMRSASFGEEKLLVELFDLHHNKDDEWVETARWVRYEEDVEGVNRHWGRPHVSCLFYDNIDSLKMVMKDAVMCNDLSAATYSDLTDHLADILKDVANEEIAVKMKAMMNVRMSHVKGLYDFKRSKTATGLSRLRSSLSLAVMDSNRPNPSNRHSAHIVESDSRKTCLDSTESAQVYAGEVPELKKPMMIFIRLLNANTFPGIEDNPLPVRFFVFIMGPPVRDNFYHEMGRSLCTMLANKEFRTVAKNVSSGQDLIDGVHGFLNSSVVLPPGEIDSKELIHVESIRSVINTREQKRKMRPETAKVSPMENLAPKYNVVVEQGENRKGYFREFRENFWRRLPFYSSDFSDALDCKCIVATVFIFLASITPAVTFGGLMGSYTGNAMGVLETLWSMCLMGTLWSFLSGQPLVIVSPTGPVLIFEGCLQAVCNEFSLDLHSIRLFTGFFVCIFCILTVAVDGQKLLSNVTTFTEDIFSLLISTIFLVESGKFILESFLKSPVTDFMGYMEAYDACLALLTNGGCENLPHPNTALLNVLLLFSTFSLALIFRKVRESNWFVRRCRLLFGDFSVAIALGVINLVYIIGFRSIYVETLDIPTTMAFTHPDARKHGMIIWPSMDRLVLSLSVSVLAALLLFIIIFVETGLTECLLSAPSRKLAKGSAKAWDMVLIGLLTLLSSVLGLPWMCPACVQSLAHAGSLAITRKKAPGQPDVIVKVVEQRVTNLLLSILVGLFTLIAGYIPIPQATLFGVFFYLGVMNMRDLDVFKRALLVAQQVKYHPKVPYVEKVTTLRMNLFTLHQVVFFIGVLCLKFTKFASLFPLAICAFVLYRKFIMPKYYTKVELDALDGEEVPVDDKDKSDENALLTSVVVV